MLSVPVASSNISATMVSPSLASSRPRSRLVLVVSSDSSLRERLRQSLTGLRWHVLEAPGGAEAWVASQDATQLEAVLIDSWLPDLNVSEFLTDFHQAHPHVDLMMTDGTSVRESLRSPYHQELLYALRRSQDGDTAAWQTAPNLDGGPQESGLHDFSQRIRSSSLPRPVPRSSAATGPSGAFAASTLPPGLPLALPNAHSGDPGQMGLAALSVSGPKAPPTLISSLASNTVSPALWRDNSSVERIPELIGNSAPMLEVSRRIRLVAARSTPVLIEGPTGSGKELVAEALHRLSSRSRKPFVAINCAAIPEALLEAELFGHTRGAFTGAVQGRTGRIEAADGGTLFLDEIGEMPLALQAKLLRFFESGELQRIGDNETVKVDVRIVAATHQPLAEDAQKGLFRADLYYRLAVFLIRTPSLMERMEDLPQLVGFFMDRMGRKSPVKRVDVSAMNHLAAHSWPGNVRELEHVLERAAILSGDEPLIMASEIDFGLSVVN